MEEVVVMSMMSDPDVDAVAGEPGAEPPSPAARIDDPNAVYALGSSSGESARLERQAEELAPDSAVLLDRVGLRPGDSAIDLGCGPRGVIDLLAGRVAPGGRVVGLDADPAHVEMASEFVTRRGLRDVEVVCGDARHTGLESGSFDLVHARTLLITVPQPAEVLGEMVRLARPGGWVAGLEPDTEAAICYPPHPAFERLCEIFAIAFSRNGADPHFGRRMAELYRQAGLTDVTVEVRAGVYPAGHSRRTIRADLARSIRPQIIAMGLADEQELDELDTAVRKHFEDPDVLVMPHLNFLAWGRKPASA
jgi:ubiquinone/menaquinone biosynthesis C-methylase UbiE